MLDPAASTTPPLFEWRAQSEGDYFQVELTLRTSAADLVEYDVYVDDPPFCFTQNALAGVLGSVDLTEEQFHACLTDVNNLAAYYDTTVCSAVA